MYLSIASCQRTASLPAAHDHHRLGLARSAAGATCCAEVFDDDLDLLRDVVGMEPDPAHDPLHGRAAFDFLLVPAPSRRWPA